MSTVQLRRYWFEPGHLAVFREWWPTLLAAREQYGFRVLFALASPQHEAFTWAVQLDGDADAFLEVQTRWNDSAERATAFQSWHGRVARTEIGFVEDDLGSLSTL